ncbi:MAG: Abi family protein [Pseudomonadota bacterium]
MYEKPYLPVPEQIELLKSRGMEIPDTDKASEYLHRIGYYRLSAYWHPMRVRDGSGAVLDEFCDGTTFKEATDLYTFDGRLRLIMLDALERLEVSLRTDVALTLGEHDPRAHRKAVFLDGRFTTPRANGAPSKHRSWLKKLDDRFLKSKDQFAEHFRAKYPSDDMPIWIAVELLDFGPLSHLIGGMTFKDRTRIGANYGGIPANVLASWVHALSFTRNVCAHHSRLWNKPLINQPSLRGLSGEIEQFLSHINETPGKNTRLCAVASVARYMLRHANPRTEWLNRFTSHILTFPNTPRLDLGAAGFSENWKDCLLWRV